MELRILENNIQGNLRKSHFKNRSLLNMYCRIFGDNHFGPFVLQERVTSEYYLSFLQNDLPKLLEEYYYSRARIWF